MDIVLRSFGRYAVGLKPLLWHWFQITPLVAGDDLVIRSNHAKRAFADRQTLRIHPRITLSPGLEQSHGAQMAAQVPAALDQYQPPVPDRIHLQSGFGHLSAIEEALTLLTFEARATLASRLAETLLPAIVNAYGARYVTGISIDAEYQQACMSFIKIALLSERYGIDKAGKLVKERSALAGALPHGINVLSYVDVLTRFSPLLFSLPVSHRGCTWHFQNDGVYWFSKAPGHGVVQQFMTDFSPLADSSHYLGLTGLEKPDDIWSYHLLRFVSEGINRLMNFLNDPRNFMSPDGKVNFLKQIQAHSAVQLIFADMNAINYSTFAHNRISYAMSALDKLTNLREHLGGQRAFMQQFAAFSQRDQIKAAISKASSRLGKTNIGKSFIDITDKCYEEIHTQLARQINKDGTSERERLEVIWMQRNVRHGPFLKRNQFEDLFLESDGNIAATIGTLPFLLLIGLISDPKRFLSFEPTLSG